MSEKTAAVRRNDQILYRDLLTMTIPPLVLAVFLYGPRPLLLWLAAVVTANLCDHLVALLRRRPYDRGEFSNEAFAAMLVLLMPASVSYYVVVVSVMAAVLVGKEAFGGVGCYPFHPTAVGYTIAAVSWPQEVFRYPSPGTVLPLTGTVTSGLVESASSTLKAGGTPKIDALNLLLGNYAAPMGAVAALILLACALFLAVRRRLKLDAALAFLAVCAAWAWLFPRMGRVGLDLPWVAVETRAASVAYELCCGALLYAAVFLLCDPVVLPRHRASRIVFGALLGAMSMMYRYFGSYETGVCFALLLVGSLSPVLDRVLLERLNKKEALRV
ncbi:MAG: RnfABCDGE type electron transport complex subunit D [Oscillospiraceae bacterium]|nr:RnfABCDGE type electron transport complex subunit D [Oscillospiraceae bacterium]